MQRNMQYALLFGSLFAVSIGLYMLGIADGMSVFERSLRHASKARLVSKDDIIEYPKGDQSRETEKTGSGDSLA